MAAGAQVELAVENWAKIVLGCLSSLAWPLAIIFIAVFFRLEVKALLSGLGGVLDRVRRDRVDIELGEKFKIHFGQEIRKVEQEAANLLPHGLSIASHRPSEARPTTVDGAVVISDAFQRYLSLADIAPRAAIMEAWREVEIVFEQMAAASFVGLRSTEVPERYVSPVVIARHLHKAKLLDDGSLKIFEDLRQLRNQAAHAKSGVEPSNQDAKEYVRLAFYLIARIHTSLPAHFSADSHS